MSGGILLDAGTNEVEVLEVLIGGQYYGVNVLKVKQVLKYNPDDITPLPSAAFSVLGTLVYQDHCVSVVDLRTFFETVPKGDAEKEVIVVTEFNEKQVAFIVDGLNKITRIHWNNLQSPTYVMKRFKSNITGVVQIDEHDVLILDLENIAAIVFGQSFNIEMDDELIVELSESASVTSSEVGNSSEVESSNVVVNSSEVAIDEVSDGKIIFCDDSGIIRDRMEFLLRKCGFNNLSIHVNGADAFQEVKKITDENKSAGRALGDGLGAVVTDLEMPVMDGFTLCKEVKEISKEIPVFIVSSLITNQMKERCNAVNADDAIPKNKAGEIMKHLKNVLR